MFQFFSRRSLLRSMTQGAAVGAAMPTTSVAALSSEQYLDSRASLAQQSPTRGAAFFVDDGSRRGWWRWHDGDLSTAARQDPLQGLTVAHAHVSPTRGGWVRDWGGLAGRPEWFGAEADIPHVDSRAAIQAALDLCSTVQLGSGCYYISGGLNILKNGLTLRGAGHTQTDQGPNNSSTRILCASPDDTILQVGAASPTRPKTLLEAIQLEGFTVDRSANPFTPASGSLGCIGIAMRWCVNCHADRVFSLNSARGWHFAGTVENYVRYCAALRERKGSNPANDVFIGFHVDQNASSGYNGGNASLYLTYCRAFPSTDPAAYSLTYSAGVRFDGGWVDCFLHGFESGGGIQYGIHGVGDGMRSESYRTEDLIVTNCILDPGGVACVWLEQAGGSAAVTLANNYFATQEGTGVVLSKIAGSVSLHANQFIVSQFGGTGLSANSVNGLRSGGNIFTGHRQPIYLSDCTNFHIADTINGRFGKPGDYPAITMLQSRRGVIDCSVAGVARSYVAAVDLRATLNRRVEVRCTGLDPDALVGGERALLLHNGAPITMSGAFGEDCLATGLLG